MKRILSKKGESHIIAIVLGVVIFGGLMLGIGGMISKSAGSSSAKSTLNNMNSMNTNISDNRAIGSSSNTTTATFGQ